MEGLETAFAYLGGVPREILFDQLKAVIVEDQRGAGGQLLENAEFLRFAAHWGFRIRGCRPYRAQTKGKVERPIRYVRSNFFYGRTFVGDADLHAQCLAWLDGVANVRVHRTTHCVPRVRFETEEREHLQPLAARAYHPLVLPPERTARRTVAHRLAPTLPSVPSVPRVVVERRGLAGYQQLAECAGDCAAGCAAAGVEEVAG
jgi:hypothetical protein